MGNKLILVISPAKLLDDKTHFPELEATQPLFLEEAEYLVKKLKKCSASKLSELMGISADLGSLNKDRYASWHLPFTLHNAIQSVMMFRGDVYRGLKAETFNKKDLAFAQDHLRILSGLYGILRPMDLIQPYRLMMGTPFGPDTKHKNLYSFWSDKLARHISGELDPKGVLINLASAEYFKALPSQSLTQRVITCEFKEKKGDKYSIVSTYAKLARGYMARYIITNKITRPEDIKSFHEEGYVFQPKLSGENDWVFSR